MAGPVWASAGAAQVVTGSAGAYTMSALAMPATVNAGDLLICHLHGRASTSVDSLVGPSGFTSVVDANTGGTAQESIFYKVAAGTEGGTTVAVSGTYTGSTNPRMAGKIHRFTGAATSGTIIGNINGGNGTSATATVPSLTTTVANETIVACTAWNATQSLGVSSSTGETGGDMVTATAAFASSLITIDLQTAAMPSPGTLSGGGIVGQSGSAAYAIAIFAIKPAASAVNTNVTLTGATYAVSAQSLTNLLSRKVTASPASYAVSAQSLSAKTARNATVSPASFAVTASALTARYGRVVGLGAATYVLTPKALSVLAAYKTALGAGSFAVTPKNLTAQYGRVSVLSAASFGLTAQSLSAKAGRKAALSATAFLYNGQGLTANYGRNVVLSRTTYSYSGQPIVTVTGRRTALGLAGFAVTPSSLAAKTGRVATLTRASIAFAGQALTVVYTPGAGAYAVTLSAATFAVTPASLTAATGRKVIATRAAYTLTAQSLSAIPSRKAALGAAAFSYTGQALTATYAAGTTAYTVTLTRAAFAFNGAALTVETPSTQQGGKGGYFDPYYYKQRNKRRTKTEDVERFVAEIASQPIGAAPEAIRDQAAEAKAAALAYQAKQTADARAKALAEINDFYKLLRLEIARRAEDESDDDFLLLSS